MNMVAMWALHRLCKRYRRYPHEVAINLTVPESVDITLIGEAIEAALRDTGRRDYR